MDHDFEQVPAAKRSPDVAPIQKILSPFSGQTIPLKDVPDPVFAEKLTGDGIAVLAESPLVLAPCEGQITLFFDTKHAFLHFHSRPIYLVVYKGSYQITL